MSYRCTYSLVSNGWFPVVTFSVNCLAHLFSSLAIFKEGMHAHVNDEDNIHYSSSSSKRTVNVMQYIYSDGH